MVEGWNTGGYDASEHHCLSDDFPVHDVPYMDTCQMHPAVFEMGMGRHGQEMSVEWLKEEMRARCAIPRQTTL